MPQYLAKDYLSEYLTSNLQFLNRNLMTTPGNLEIVSDYIHKRRNTNNYQQECFFKDFKKEQIDVFKFPSDFQDALFTLNSSTLENELETFGTECKKKNALPVDSVSESDLGSFKNHGVFDEEIYQSIISPSLCSAEIKRCTSPITELMMEEMVDFWPSSDFQSIKKLTRRLRPVRVVDPYSSMKPVNHQLIESVLPERSALDSNMNMKFQKIILVEDSPTELLEEVFSVPKQNENVPILITIQSQLSLKKLNGIEKKDFEKLQKLSNYNHSQLEVINDMTMQPKSTDYFKHIPLEDDNKMLLDSPCSDVLNVCCKNYSEVPNMCTKVSIDKNEMSVISPCSQAKIEKELQESEKVFGDLLLMLLPEEKVPDELYSGTISIPPKNYFQTSVIDEQLELGMDWDPMSHASPQMKSAFQSIVTKQKKIQDHFPLLPSQKSFLKTDLKTDETDFQLTNWKLEENKLQSLAYITSYKKPSGGRDIPSTTHVQAPKRYHKLYVEKQSPAVQKSRNRLSTEKKQDSFARKPPTTSTPYQSPLDLFMMLRTGQLQRPTDKENRKVAIVTPVSTLSVAKVRPMMHLDCNTSGNTKANQIKTNTPEKQNRKAFTRSQEAGTSASLEAKKTLSPEIKSSKTLKVINIQVTKEFQSIVNAIEKDSGSLLRFLKESQCINEDLKILSVSPDVTRFLVKEEFKKKCTDTSRDKLRGVLCLHALVQVIDVLLHCNMVAAGAVLKSYNHEHQNILRNCLEPMRKKIASFHATNEKDGIFHVKLTKIQQLIEHWITLDCNVKVIIIIQRYFELIAPTIQCFLSGIKGLVTNLYPSTEASQDVYIDTFYKANVIIAHENEDLQTCPWEYFQYVIQYEYNKESHWHEMIYQACMESMMPVEKDRTTHTLLCTKKISMDKELLVCLESKQNIQVFVKSYSQLKTQTPYTYQPDILIDERTGISIFILNDILDDLNCVNEINNTIISVALKCCSYCVIFYIRNGKSYDGHCKLISYVGQLVAKINSDFDHVKCKMFYSYSSQQLSEIIRMQCDLAMGASKVWTKQQWCNRTWLSEDVSKHENFLMSYPFFNSFCVQVMLNEGLPFRSLFQMPLEELKCNFKRIPYYVLKAFHKANEVMSYANLPLLNVSSMEGCLSPQNYGTSFSIEEIIREENNQQNGPAFMLTNRDDLPRTAQHISPVLQPIEVDTSKIDERIDFVCHTWDQSPNSDESAKFKISPYNVIHPNTLNNSAGSAHNRTNYYQYEFNQQNDFISGRNSDQSFNTGQGSQLCESRNQDRKRDYPLLNNMTCLSHNDARHNVNNLKFHPRFDFYQNKHTYRGIIIDDESNKLPLLQQPKHQKYVSTLNKENIPPSQQYLTNSFDQRNNGRSEFNDMYPIQQSYIQNPSTNFARVNKQPFSSKESNYARAVLRKPAKALQRIYPDQPQAFDLSHSTPSYKSNQNKTVKAFDKYEISNRKQRCTGTPSSVSLSSKRKRRLTYEKVPGSHGGQTRLTFL
ncbi:protein shortage in chiasmata 1 ortholog-like isoform X2 [Hydractinia symbiolongicarpus]|uniref:protein shortage in chiasmata 1 ortholog-like isoform X2 n=1 Tax=Hydractinia symbiolongicarpus TaxID=13093 RepID=UPI00254A1D4E|nr:protein shortage in chiasmata 1 ortholog-like isoform X2 [Hydractinia symbiolongicarpus]